MKFLLVLATLVPAFVFANVSSASAVKCQTYDSQFLGKHVRYCMQRSVDDSQQMAGENVIYIMHGMGGSSASWEEGGFAETFSKLVASENFPKMTIVTFDTDVDSFFSDYGDVHTGSQAYETWFIKEFIPMIEKIYGVCNHRECRAVAGVSMGGFGSLKTLLRHPDMFFSGAAISPALPPFSIHEANFKWTDYFNRHPIGSFQGHFLLSAIRKIFPTEAVFQGNDPSALIAKIPSRYPISLSFDAGGKDYFGFEEGYARFKAAIEKTKIPFMAKLDPEAGHEASEPRRIAMMRFLRDKFMAQEAQHP